MTQVEYLHICDYAFNAEGGKACLIGIFDRLRVSKLPLKYPAMTIALKLRGEPGANVAVEFALRGPNTKRAVANLKAEVSLGPAGQSTFFLNVTNLLFERHGPHTLTVSAHDEVMATTTVLVEPKGAQTSRQIQ